MSCLLPCLLVTSLWSLPASAAPGSSVGEKLLQAIDATGNVTDKRLRSKTGIVAAHAFRWTIELKDARGKYRAVSSSRVFRSGDEFRLRIATYSTLFVYVAVQNADGSLALLVPTGKEEIPRLKRGEQRIVPVTGGGCSSHWRPDAKNCGYWPARNGCPGSRRNISLT